MIICLHLLSILIILYRFSFITGVITCNGNAVVGAKMECVVNGKVVKIVTDHNGRYTITARKGSEVEISSVNVDVSEITMDGDAISEGLPLHVQIGEHKIVIDLTE